LAQIDPQESMAKELRLPGRDTARADYPLKTHKSAAYHSKQQSRLDFPRNRHCRNVIIFFRGRPVTANVCPFNSRVSLVGDRMIHKDRSWPVSPFHSTRIIVVCMPAFRHIAEQGPLGRRTGAFDPERLLGYPLSRSFKACISCPSNTLNLRVGSECRAKKRNWEAQKPRICVIYGQFPPDYKLGIF
jgi:hypothetical protein